jgi:hypothetical protein
LTVVENGNNPFLPRAAIPIPYFYAGTGNFELGAVVEQHSQTIHCLVAGEGESS